MEVIMKTGVKTSEFWVALLVGPIIALIKTVWPDAPEAEINTVLVAAIAYIVGRSAIKVKNGG